MPVITINFEDLREAHEDLKRADDAYRNYASKLETARDVWNTRREDYENLLQEIRDEAQTVLKAADEALKKLPDELDEIPEPDSLPELDESIFTTN